jgi:hypothetical protein
MVKCKISRLESKKKKKEKSIKLRISYGTKTQGIKQGTQSLRTPTVVTRETRTDVYTKKGTNLKSPLMPKTHCFLIG